MDQQIYFEIGGGLFVLSFILAIVFVRRRKRRLQPGTTQKVKAGLTSLLASKLDALILSTKQFDENFLESLEELLYTGDLGTKTVNKLLETVRQKMSHGQLSDLAKVKNAL